MSGKEQARWKDSIQRPQVPRISKPTFEQSTRYKITNKVITTIFYPQDLSVPLPLVDSHRFSGFRSYHNIAKNIPETIDSLAEAAKTSAT